MDVTTNQQLADAIEGQLYIRQFCNCPIDALIIILERFFSVL